jgi:hypothetical protein
VNRCSDGVEGDGFCLGSRQRGSHLEASNSARVEGERGLEGVLKATDPGHEPLNTWGHRLRTTVIARHASEDSARTPLERESRRGLLSGTIELKHVSSVSIASSACIWPKYTFPCSSLAEHATVGFYNTTWYHGAIEADMFGDSCPPVGRLSGC